jgi:hypothetical protein
LQPFSIGLCPFAYRNQNIGRALSGRYLEALWA